MNNKEINLHSYENVERVQLRESSEKELLEYYHDKMLSAKADADFIERIIYKNIPLSVCEIGSGNSKLLYVLEQRRILSRGVGYEVSRSRYEMAQKFGELSNSEVVDNRNKNFLEDVTNEQFDVIILVDIVFQLISAMGDDSERDALHWIRASLKPGGYALFELEDYSEVIKEIEEKGTLRKWEEYDASDPFQYGLHESSIQENDLLEMKKIFIKRDSNERDVFTNILKSYSPDKIQKLLRSYDFQPNYYELSKEELQELENGKYHRYLYRVVARKWE